MNEHFDCERVQRWIDGQEKLQDGPLTVALAHLDTCEECAGLFADAQYLRERLDGYEAPRCPDEVVDAIWARIDAEESLIDAERGLSWWSPAAWSRWMVPAAALGLLLFVFIKTPSPEVETQTPPLLVERSEESSEVPCDLDINEIYKRLGIDPARPPYDEETICAAAEEVRTAMAVVGKAMSSTRQVIGHETRDRMADTMKKGLGSGVASPTIHAPGSEEGG